LNTNKVIGIIILFGTIIVSLGRPLRTPLYLTPRILVLGVGGRGKIRERILKKPHQFGLIAGEDKSSVYDDSKQRQEEGTRDDMGGD
jgi:hypothetical protein